jgi:hypothetical protein
VCMVRYHLKCKLNPDEKVQLQLNLMGVPKIIHLKVIGCIFQS